MRRLIRDDPGIRLDAGSGKSHAVGFSLEDTGQRPAVPLAQGDNAATSRPSMLEEPSVNSVCTRIGWTNMTAEIGAVDFDRAIEDDLPTLDGKRLSQLVGQDESSLVGHIDTAREL